MYKFELNADLKEVWKRLAGNYAGIAQVGERLLRTQEGGASNASTGSSLKEKQR